MSLEGDELVDPGPYDDPLPLEPVPEVEVELLFLWWRFFADDDVLVPEAFDSSAEDFPETSLDDPVPPLEPEEPFTP